MPLNQRIIIVSTKGIVSGVLIGASPGLRYFVIGVSAAFAVSTNDREQLDAAVKGFLTGQIIIFLSAYDRPRYEMWMYPHGLILIFMESVLVPFFWANRKTLRNAEFWRLDPKVRNAIIKKKVKRALRLQLAFLLNVILLLVGNPVLKPDSPIPQLVNHFIFSYKNENKILFIVTSIGGSLIAQTFFTIYFSRGVLEIKSWLKKNFAAFFSKKKKK